MSEGSGLIARFYRGVIGNGDLSLIDELTADDLVDHEEGLPGQPPGKEGVKYFVTAMREAFPDIAPIEVSPMLADGDLEAARTVLRGTHRGQLMGVEPTQTTVEIESIDIIRVVDGKVAEHWGVTDTAGLMMQIGALPQPA
jgi:predicted ester cyclase